MIVVIIKLETTGGPAGGRFALRQLCDDSDAATQDPELWARPRGPYEYDLRARWFVPIENVIGEIRPWCRTR